MCPPFYVITMHSIFHCPHSISSPSHHTTEEVTVAVAVAVVSTVEVATVNSSTKFTIVAHDTQPENYQFEHFEIDRITVNSLNTPHICCSNFENNM